MNQIHTPCSRVPVPARLSAAALVRSAILGVALLGSPALARQTPPADCAKQLEDTKKQLDSAQNRIRELNAENDRLRRQLSEATQGAPGTSAPPAGAAPVPEEPLSSPEALMRALVKSYERNLTGKPRDTRHELSRYHGEVRDWVRDVAREIRGPFAWNIVVQSVATPSAASSAADVTFTVVGPDGKGLGAPVTTSFPVRFAKQLAQAAPQSMWKVVGTGGARPNFNEKRAEPGATNDPPLIGPFAEFGFDLQIRSVDPAATATP